MMQKITIEIYHEWTEILIEYGISSQTAKNIASMVYGDPQLAGGKIHRPEELIRTVRTASRLFGEIDLTQVGVRSDDERKVKKKLTHVFFLDLLLRAQCSLNGFSASTPGVETRSGNSIDEMSSTQLLTQLERIADQISFVEDEPKRSLKSRYRDDSLADIFDSFKRHEEPTANDLYEFLEKVDLSNDEIETVLTDLAESTKGTRDYS